MAVQHDIALPGCTPEPLMAYLKALGILRLVAEQKDSEARGWWKNDVFWLRSTVNTDTIAAFFLENYGPTPIMSPWAGGSGFFENDNRDAVNKLRASGSRRAESYSRAIGIVHSIIVDAEVGDKPQGADKKRLIRRYRCELPDEVVAWMDAAMAILIDGQSPAPLLGTGGNDARLDFAQNFMQRVVLLRLHTDGPPEDKSRRWLDQALWSVPERLDSASVGQFSPGRAGGANATQGMEGKARDNPWDFLLMLEGALLFAGTAARRLDSLAPSRAAFPFTVNVTGAGDPGITFGDQFKPKQTKRSLAEIWLPLWGRAASLAEIRSLVAEGRVTVAGRDAHTGVDFARAASTLGVDRGIDAFQRTMFLMRNGQSFLAISAGRFEVHERREVDLLGEVDAWLRSFAMAAGDKNAPPRFRTAHSRVEEAMFDLCRYGGRAHLQAVLVALGQAERELSLTPGRVGQSKVAVRPLVGLSAQWVTQSEDLTTEFVIARALAAMRGDELKVGPFRTHLEATATARSRSGESYASWTEEGRAVVWNSADLPTNLANVLERRMMDSARGGGEFLPLASVSAVPVNMISAFIAGDVDDKRIEDLIWGLMLVSHNSPQRRGAAPTDDQTVPRHYALLKMLFLPRPLLIHRSANGVVARLLRDGEDGGIVIRPEPAVLQLLRSGRIGEACVTAMRRLRASGLDPLPGALPGGRVRDGEWRELDDMGSAALDPQRLAAALLFPISDASVRTLVRLVIRGDGMRGNETDTGAEMRFEGDDLL